MSNKGNFYSYYKYIGISIILIIIISYLGFYFYPSLRDLREKKKTLEANVSKIESFKKELENFVPPDKQEKLLWEKIEDLSSEKYIKITKKSDFLKYVNSIIYKLENILSSQYKDFLISINDKDIKLTQTFKQNSALISEFKTMGEGQLLATKIESQTQTFRAFDNGKQLQKNETDKGFKVKIFVVSNLRESSIFLIELFKNIGNFRVEKILIKRKDSKTYYLFVLSFRVKRLNKNA